MPEEPDVRSLTIAQFQSDLTALLAGGLDGADLMYFSHAGSFVVRRGATRIGSLSIENGKLEYTPRDSTSPLVMRA